MADYEEDESTAPADASAVVKRAYDFFKISASAEEDNRRRGLFALQFAQGGDYQWDEQLLGTRNLDARPSESYNQIPNFVNQVVNDGRMNMPQTRFIPGEDGDKETAEKMEDLARNIQSQSDAEIAYDNALYGQTVNGWGYWRYVTDYENDKSFDQIIRIKPVWNPFTIYDDPFAIEVDKLDRKRLLQIEDIKKDDFNEEYDRDYDALDLESIGDSCPGWAGTDTIRVAEYWELTQKSTKLWRNKKTLKITDEEPENTKGYESRDVLIPTVTWYKINGKEVLDKREWPGIYIPYVKVVGNEVNIDGKNIITGMVERLIPAQKQMNYWLNAATEAMALAPKSPWIVDPESVGPFQSVWDTANIRNYAYLPALSRTSDGKELRAPSRSDSNANLNGFVVMVQQAQQNFYNLSGIYPASLGQASNEKSGKAILARQKEGDVSTFHIQDNMARGQRGGGRILEDLMRKVYDGSRTVTGKKEDGSTYLMPINQKYQDEKTGEQKEHDLTVGTYSIAVTTGPSYSTKRTESSEFYNQLIQSFPEAASIFGDIAIGASDAAGADRAAERMKRFISMQSPGLIDDEGEEPIPPQVKGQIVQMQQQLQQAQQIIQQGAQELQNLEGQLADKQADIAKQQADIEAKRQQALADQMESQRKAELDKLQYDLDLEKLEVAKEDKHINALKLQLEIVKARLVPQEENSSPAPDIDLNNPDAVQAHLDNLVQMQVDDQAQKAMDMELRAQKEANDGARWDSLLQGLSGVQQMLAANAQATTLLTVAVKQPKEIIRDASGLAQGLVTAPVGVVQ